MRQPRPKRTLPDHNEETSRMHGLLEEHLVWMQTQNFSEDTVSTRRSCLGYFLDWCRDRALDDPREITRPVLERYQRWLFQYRKKNGAPLTFRTQNFRLRAIKGFFRWLARQNHILHNPASELLLPRLENRLPKYILNAEEAERVIAQPDTGAPEGLRDRAILETFYATGMRRMEVANLKLYDIDKERGTLMIRQGKGKKDRHIPIGERALAWIEKYIREARPELQTSSEDGTVFLTDAGDSVPPRATDHAGARLSAQIEDRQKRRLPSVPPHGGDIDARKRRRHPGDPGNAGPRQAHNDRAIHARIHQSAEAGLRRHASGREFEAAPVRAARYGS